MVFIAVVGLCFYCLFSYLSLLELQYGGGCRNPELPGSRLWRQETQ